MKAHELQKLRRIADRNPNIFRNKVLSLTNQNIIQIGMLREPAYEVEQLILSKNIIQDLRGIEQFPNLRKLDLSHNQVSINLSLKSNILLSKPRRYTIFITFST